MDAKQLELAFNYEESKFAIVFNMHTQSNPMFF